MTVITTARPRRRRRWGRLRGTLAVAALLLSAAEQLVSAVTGFPPPSWRARQLAAPIAATWRAAAWCPGGTWQDTTAVIWPAAAITPASERNPRDAADA